MSETLKWVQVLVAAGDYRSSSHGVGELEKDGLIVEDLIESLPTAVVVEDYPTAHYGPSVLVLQVARDGKPAHVPWGVPGERGRPAVLVTAYRPDPSKWSIDLLRRIR